MHILVAEPKMAEMAELTAMLAQDGHDLVCHGDANAALKSLRSEQDFDVLITAVNFTSLSGFELSWEARLLAGQGRPIYVIMMSPTGDEQQLVEALDCGADDFITSPLCKTELLARLRAAARLLHAQRDLIRLAFFDSLTGLRNRRSFFEKLEKFGDVTEPVSVLMLDVDHFKKINDTYGHEVGDDVLREMGRRLTGFDKAFARLGGEEFALLLKSPLRLAADQAERLRILIAGTPFETGAGPLAITASIGVAGRLPGPGIENLMKDADIALYAAKANGRNCVSVARSRANGPALPEGTGMKPRISLRTRAPAGSDNRMGMAEA